MWQLFPARYSSKVATRRHSIPIFLLSLIHHHYQFAFHANAKWSTYTYSKAQVWLNSQNHQVYKVNKECAIPACSRCLSLTSFCNIFISYIQLLWSGIAFVHNWRVQIDIILKFSYSHDFLHRESYNRGII